jgi:ABC-2 type transport system ATP-binding protein
MSGVGLAVYGLSKAYGRNAVLRGVDLTFSPGRIGALVGPNGAGKTTLFRIAAGLQRADAGEVGATAVLYYGGFDVLPLRGTVNGLRRALGLAEARLLGERRMKGLSRGELQRAGLDVALDLRCRILLLDEPWTALEPDVRDELSSRLRARADEGTTVVVSSHELDEVARVADDIAFLRGGRATMKSREEMGEGGFDRARLMALFREEIPAG